MKKIFDRVPLLLLSHTWFIENISFVTKTMYDGLKRIMDILIAIILGVLSLFFYPVIFILIKLEDGGPMFFFQDRIGQNNAPIRIVKFRTMSVNESEKVTKVGIFLRKSRIDELPQLWNVLKGDLSLVGPRPEIPPLVEVYEKEVPYYDIRHLIKPGLSGWAQIHQDKPPKFAAALHETKTKLSYDLYYIKNRSFLLDLKIALQTVKTLVSRSGQ